MQELSFQKATGHLADPVQEELYQQDAWPRVQQQLGLVYGCCLVLVFAMMLSTIIQYDGQASSSALLAVRAVQFTTIAYVLWSLRACHFSLSVSIALVVAESAALAGEVSDYFIAYTPPQVPTASLDMPFMTLLIFFIYILFPNRSYFNACVCLFWSVVLLLTLSTIANLPSEMMTNLIIGFIFVNVLGIFYERYINRVYRTDFMHRVSLEREIGERRRVQAELTQAKDLLEQNHALRSRFLSAASHDLRQPLNAMGLMLESIKVSDQANLDILQKTFDAKDSLDELFENVLEILRVDVGNLESEIKPLAVQQVFDTLREEFSPISADKGVELTVVQSSLTLMSDRPLLERVLRNLLDNALKFTHHGRVLLGVRRRGNMASIEVWDTGIGIDIADQGVVFNEFHQLNNPERDRRKGLGLGLTRAQKIAEFLGLRIELKSVTGKGSCFSIDIPITDKPVAQQTATYELTNSLSGMHVLVIEDDVMVREAMGFMLESWYCQPMLSADEEGAAALIEELAVAPDIIVSDYRLRDGATGVQVCKNLLRDFDLDCPILLITGETDTVNKAEVKASGYTILNKPLKPAKLRLLLNELASA